MGAYKYSITMLFLIIISITLFLSLLFSSTPFNPVQNKLKFTKYIFNLTPQGWAFFTRDAREEQVFIYKIENSKLYKINQKHSNIENFFGISRKVSKVGIELENVTGKILINSAALKTTWNYNENLIGKIPDKFIAVKNPIEDPIMCGDYLIVYHQPVPWAWSKNKERIKMPAKVIKLKILCQK
ncbi:SdpA family antimicrobial peptide system protein [Chryseobacterium sp. RRHN12]|uniref:SdpA family antimicrobial peptide system protein n=1 Tax=Chryseobacterium sp. RRHN12 TaxID=3437884 RepID=UPI002FC91E5B